MDFLGLLRTVAPWIATAITGPLGGIAIDAACTALGASEKTTAGLKKALSGVSTEQMVALQQADQAFALKMQEMGFQQTKDLEAISAEDRASARNLLVQVRSWVPAALSVFVTAGFFALLLGMMLGTLHVQDSQALLMLLGALTTAWMGVMNFWFGSSSSSEQKTQLLAKAGPIEKGVAAEKGDLSTVRKY